MDKNKNCSACNIKLDIYNYKKKRTVRKDCLNKKKRKNNSNNTLIHSQQSKSETNHDNVKNKRKVVYSVNNNNRTLIIGFSNCGKTYLMNQVLHQKQEPILQIQKH